ncbi:MAG: PH domain-containing protein [Actinomycetota bacterium]|nr:PH domain-containing protein [Actinomycetota bacterium]
MKAPAHSLDRRVLGLWWAASAALVALVAIGCGIAWLVDLLPLPLAVAIVLVAAALGGFVPPVRYRLWAYEIRTRDLYTSRGGLFVTRTLIPFDRIQFVETRQGPLDRAFSLHQLVVYTAAGQAGRIPGLGDEEANSLREELSRVAGTDSV